MTSIGNSLRQERLNQGRSLHEIAEQTKISSRYLEAIETDHLDWLPGTFFYKSFVRQYAGALGLPPEHYSGLVDELVGPPPEIEFTPQNFPIKPLDPIVMDTNRRFFSDRRVGWSMAALVVVALGCSALYSWWGRSDSDQARPAVSAPEPARPTPAPPVTHSDPATPNTTASATAVNKPQVQQPAVQADEWQINVSAREKTWLSLVSDGKHLFSGVLEPSETKTLQGKQPARLLVGNAGGIELVWNGRPIGPLGNRGQVCTVLLSRDNYQIVPSGHEL